MPKTLPLLIFSAIASSALAQETYLSTNFTTGIPDTYTLINCDEASPVASNFRNIIPKSEWFRCSYLGSAMSCSRRTAGIATDNWLITPQLHIAAPDTWLTWDAASVHHDLRDGYKVMVSTTGTEPEDFTELLNIEEESYWQQHRMLPLHQYQGQGIYIAFVHTSTNKFLLSIDNIFVGQMAEVAFEGTDRTKRFCGNTGTTTVSGSIRNTGRAVSVQQVDCIADGETYTIDFSNAEMPTGAETPFIFNIPVEVGKAAHYAIEVATTDGTRHQVLADSVVCSYFERRLLLDELTGAWCNNCPSMKPFVYDMEKRYADQLVALESHCVVNGQDNGLNYDPYFYQLDAREVPTIYYNRNLQDNAANAYKPFDTQELAKAIMEPTVAHIDLEANYTDDGQIAVRATSLFANDFDNSDDRYRIGIAIIEKNVQGLAINKQQNNCTSVQNREFFFMPTSVPEELMVFHNVVRHQENAIIGIAQSLATGIEAHVPYVYETTLSIPAPTISTEAGSINLPVSKDQLAVVAVILDTKQSINRRTAALNAAECKISSTDLEKVVAQTVKRDWCITTQGSTIYFQHNGEKAAQVLLYSVDGKLFKQSTVHKGRHEIASSLPAGIYLVKAQTSEGEHTEKLMLR